MLTHHEHQPVGSPRSGLPFGCRLLAVESQVAAGQSIPFFEPTGDWGSTTQLGPLQLGITLGECFAITSEASCSPGAHPSTLRDKAHPREHMLELCRELCRPR